MLLTFLHELIRTALKPLQACVGIYVGGKHIMCSCCSWRRLVASARSVGNYLRCVNSLILALLFCVSSSVLAGVQTLVEPHRLADVAVDHLTKCLSKWTKCLLDTVEPIGEICCLWVLLNIKVTLQQQEWTILLHTMSLL